MIFAATVHLLIYWDTRALKSPTITQSSLPRIADRLAHRLSAHNRSFALPDLSTLLAVD
jgi:hypothetical protein